MELVKIFPMLCILYFCIITITKASDDKECNCGQASANRIVGGSKPAENSLQMVVAIEYIPDKNVYCGGAIITDKHVLTAAHCFDGLEENLKDVAILVGIHNLKDDKKDDADHKYEIEKITVHPEYDYLINENDLAIVELKKKLKLSMKVGTGCLPFYYADTRFVGAQVYATGWGSISDGGPKSDTLRVVNTKVVASSKCKQVHRHLDETKVLCTEHEKHESCKDDSGSPVLWKNSTSDHWMLLGVITEGGCGRQPSINMYTRSFLDFIESSTSDYDYCRVY